MNFDLTRITSSEILKRYVEGGHGECILEAPSGNFHKYIFLKPRDADAFPDDVIFVSCLHEDKRFYLGMIEGSRFRTTRHSRFDDSCEVVKGAKYLYNLALNQNMLDSTRMKVYHCGVCCKCGRKLTSEKYLKLGIGKKCLKKMEVSNNVD